MKKMKPSIGEYFNLPNPGLWAYFKHNVDGNPEDYRTPLWRKADRSKVLQLWQNILDASGLSESLPCLYDFEMDMKSKVGPLSIEKPLTERIESVEQYFTCVKEAGEPIDRQAIEATIKFFSKMGGLRLRSYSNVVRKMKLSTNSGSPEFTKRRLVVNETLKQLPLIAIDDNLWTHDMKYKLCAVQGWRGQEGGIDWDDVKQRVVFMMPFPLNIMEHSFYQPAIDAVKKHKLIPAYISMDYVDQEVTALFDTKSNDDVAICTDFTKFDQHFNVNMQNAAYTIEEALATPQSRPEMLRMFFWKFEIPLVCSENLMYSGKHGMGSGSVGTNFDECMAHKALQFEAALSDNATLNPHSMAYGDDGILTWPGITVDKVIQSYQRHGQEMNDSKQYVSTHDCVVLRRWHGTEYRVNGTMVGVYATMRALGRLLGQERFYDPEKWSPKMVVLRSLSIIENCKWHPLFEKFVDFVIKGDKFKLGLAIPGFFDNLEKFSKEASDIFTDFLGYTKSLQDDDPSSGIMNWRVVKYLQSKM